MQLQLIVDKDDQIVDVTMLARRIDETFDRVENVRKGTFKRHGDTGKMIMSLVEAVTRLEMKVAGLERDLGKTSWDYSRGNGELFQQVL